MKIALIAAMDQSLGIGFEGKIPWHLSTDLKHFKKVTMGHHVLFGRKTWESIGRPLKGRVPLVLSKDPNYVPSYAPTLLTDEPRIAAAFALGAKEEVLFVGGGESLYKEMIDFAEIMHLTIIHERFKCDRFFPIYNPDEWFVEEESNHKEKDLSFSIQKLVRMKPEEVVLADNLFFFCIHKLLLFPKIIVNFK